MYFSLYARMTCAHAMHIITWWWCLKWRIGSSVAKNVYDTPNALLQLFLRFFIFLQSPSSVGWRLAIVCAHERRLNEPFALSLDDCMTNRRRFGNFSCVSVSRFILFILHFHLISKSTGWRGVSCSTNNIVVFYSSQFCFNWDSLIVTEVFCCNSSEWRSNCITHHFHVLYFRILYGSWGDRKGCDWEREWDGDREIEDNCSRRRHSTLQHCDDRAMCDAITAIIHSFVIDVAAAVAVTWNCVNG